MPWSTKYHFLYPITTTNLICSTNYIMSPDHGEDIWADNAFLVNFWQAIWVSTEAWLWKWNVLLCSLLRHSASFWPRIAWKTIVQNQDVPSWPHTLQYKVILLKSFSAFRPVLYAINSWYQIGEKKVRMHSYSDDTALIASINTLGQAQ